MRMLLRNGTVVNADRAAREDVLIENGKIISVAPEICADADTVLDAAGKLLFPGFIDTHTHFDLDLGVTVTADDFRTGTAAAVLGGTTTVLDFCTQDRGMTMQQALNLWKRKAQGSSCNYGFHLAVSEWNPEREAEIDSMIRQGVTSFKMYMVYDNMRVDDGSIYRALKQTGMRDCIVGVHCENYDVLNERIRELHAAGVMGPEGHPASRPNAVEAEGVARLMRIAELAGMPAWVVHLSTREGLEEARRARNRGQEVYLETCPQYLILDQERYGDPDGEKFIMSPPLRSGEDREALLSALALGEIDFIGTDHCSFTMEQKALGRGDFAKVPNGGAGVQNRAELVYTYAVRTGRITPMQMAALLSERAARIFGMYPDKGRIGAGSDADIAVLDPSAAGVISWKTNAHACDNSPFEGIPVSGRVTDVILNGVHAVSAGKLTQPGCGRFVFRRPSERPRKPE